MNGMAKISNSVVGGVGEGGPNVFIMERLSQTATFLRFIEHISTSKRDTAGVKYSDRGQDPKWPPKRYC